MSRVPPTAFAPFGPRPVRATATARTTTAANQTSELMGENVVMPEARRRVALSVNALSFVETSHRFWRGCRAVVVTGGPDPPRPRREERSWTPRTAPAEGRHLKTLRTSRLPRARFRRTACSASPVLLLLVLTQGAARGQQGPGDGDGVDGGGPTRPGCGGARCGAPSPRRAPPAPPPAAPPPRSLAAPGAACRAQRPR